ncbi:hypothetical protein [Streptomyces sp. NPDC059468]|uniref:hypothetical protein n=1 Tax=Streptomyces sp. NPDC059468 TaxID=3346845 RepID=UPI0036B4402C
MASGPVPPVGSIGVVATGGIIGWGIRLLTFSRYNHAFIVGPAGLLVEAQPGGARIGHISMYPKAVYNTDKVIPDETRLAIWETALGFAQANNGKGIGYNWLDDAALGLRFFGVWSDWIAGRIARQDRLQCAQLCDLAYSLNGIHLFDDGRLPLAVDPGDLRETF